MEYERIDKPQPGMLSPSKLRMKLMGAHDQKKKDAAKTNSSRTSPARSAVEDCEMVNNGLLDSTNGDFDEEVQSSGPQNESNFRLARKNDDVGRDKLQPHPPKTESCNSSVVHPVKYAEDENLDYDSNASSSSFEFHKGDRAVHTLTRSFSRPTSSKWNDAEKWLVNKQFAQSNHPRIQNLQPQGNRSAFSNMGRVVPEAAARDYRFPLKHGDAKQGDLCQAAMQLSVEKFSFVHPGDQHSSFQANVMNSLVSLCPQIKNLKEVAQNKTPNDDLTAASPTVRAVCMRDMGTEMTPVPSQEPSRTATPVGSTTPLRSPISSLPSTPRRGEPATTPSEEVNCDSCNGNMTENGKQELSEQEKKLKTRREIVALGVQLGKMNIAAWASKDEPDKQRPGQVADQQESVRNEFEKRAAAWEEAEKSKHAARYKREEIRIQAWESQQKAKLEAEMRKIEAKIEEMRTHAQAKMMKKIAMTRKRSDEKRAAAAATKECQAERTASQAEYIRQTGQMPTAHYICCGLFS